MMTSQFLWHVNICAIKHQRSKIATSSFSVSPMLVHKLFQKPGTLSREITPIFQGWIHGQTHHFHRRVKSYLKFSGREDYWPSCLLFPKTPVNHLPADFLSFYSEITSFLPGLPSGYTNHGTELTKR